MGSVSLRLVKVCQIFLVLSFLVKSQHGCCEGPGKKGDRPSGELPASHGEGHGERPGERGGGQQARPDSLHGGGHSDAAGDVPHPPLLGKLQGCWKREPLPSCSDCGSPEGEGRPGMHCKKIHAQGTACQGRFLQGNPNQPFHQWPCSGSVSNQKGRKLWGKL